MTISGDGYTRVADAGGWARWLTATDAHESYASANGIAADHCLEIER
jgi:hypothetical protein